MLLKGMTFPSIDRQTSSAASWGGIWQIHDKHSVAQAGTCLGTGRAAATGRGIAAVPLPSQAVNDQAKPQRDVRPCAEDVLQGCLGRHETASVTDADRPAGTDLDLMGALRAPAGHRWQIARPGWWSSCACCLGGPRTATGSKKGRNLTETVTDFHQTQSLG